ncbi:formylglycine-generating enzyme family protein [Maridesulfovibrio frigidus]|uniref:formylglycine-generating enzyme family protein n=1 Tax=Maridesulfovibrio frigidus TaxID=340956 RepID=UPI00068F896A|nr:formylglycine-generating enzyme family protein [Maridesulfovibrio frigidus]
MILNTKTCVWEKLILGILLSVFAVGCQTSQAQKTAQRDGENKIESATAMELVWIPGGCYQMGQTESEKAWLVKEEGQGTYDKSFSNELPRHEVCVDGFWMGKYEVTREQFQKFIQATGYQTDAETDGWSWKWNNDQKKTVKTDGVHWNREYSGRQGSHPVTYVSWNDANAFAKWLSQKDGVTYRLPTEAEWEYAARGGTQTMRFWGDDEENACEYANLNDQDSKAVHTFSWRHFICSDGYALHAPVGSYKQNPFGLHDMLGNVWEWCQDGYDPKAYSSNGRDNPFVKDGAKRVIRGGSWSYKASFLRSAYRGKDTPEFRRSNLGFRIVKPMITNQ